MCCRIQKAVAVMKDARRIKRRGKAIPMHQDGESVVEVPKALSVEVSQIGAFALPRAERLRIAQPLRAWLEENGRLRATIWPVRRQAVRRFLATCQAPPRRIRRPRPLSPLTWHLHLEDVITNCIWEGPMNRPTIADLAKAAGVSVSTVNRLLHGSGTLRPQTDLILSAAQQIGFHSSGPRHERRRDNLPHRHLSFLMQQSHRPLCQIWAEALLDACARRTDAVIEPDVLFEDDPSPEAVAANLLKIGESADAIAVISADHPLVGQAIDELRIKGVPVIAYVTDLSAASRAGFVGTDNWKAGRTAAWFISQTSGRPGNPTCATTRPSSTSAKPS